MTSQKQIKLKIADLIISVSTNEASISFNISTSLIQFVSKNEEQPNVYVNFILGIPQEYNNYIVLFTANKEIGKNYNDFSIYNWCICNSNNKKFIRIFSNEDKKYPNMIAIFEENTKYWTIYIEKLAFFNEQIEIDPFIYPLGPLMLYYINTFNNGLMIHASGIKDINNGYVFCGSSGVGKTTISKIWHNENSLVINDDRLIIRKKFDKYVVYNTPMNYFDDSKNVLLSEIFILKHSKSNFANKVDGSEAVALLMSNCIQHNYEKKYIISLLNICSDICKSVPVYELGFVPDKSVVQFIRTNEFK